MTDVRLQGGCHCGAVRYECASAISEPAICHCTSCRRTIGAHAVAWMTVKRPTFRLVQGAPREYASSNAVVRGFCEHCGCSLTYSHRKHPDTIDVTIASLDQSGSVVPTDHIWMSDAPPWDRPGDALPQHGQWRGAP